MDTFGTIDAFMRITFFGKTVETKPVTAENDSAALEQEIWLPIQWPLSTDKLVIQCFDKDIASADIVGSMNFSLKDVLNKGALDLTDKNGQLVKNKENKVQKGYFFW